MLYPSVQQLTRDEVNRYRLVIATAKCARHVNSKMQEEHDYAEKHKDSDHIPKEVYADFAVRKPLSIAVQKIASGKYTIVDKDV